MEKSTGEGADAPAGTRETGAVDLATLLRFVDAAVDGLAAARSHIDALNVYPVPDGDTGTNMYLTLAAARDGLHEALRAESGTGSASPGTDDDRAARTTAALASFARGALMGARGNSGVILSELLGALARRFSAIDPHERLGEVVADALQSAAHSCYAAVGEPVEGTMLTVLREAAEAAGRAARLPRSRSADVFAAASQAAQEALDRTPDQLDVLGRAGVVDAGGAGICVLLDAAETVVSGKRSLSRRPAFHPPAARPQPAEAQPASPTADDVETVAARSAESAAEGGAAEAVPVSAHGYEVMYLLDAEDDRVADLRTDLGRIGDSVVVVGGEGLWNVHVHTDDVGAAIEAGLALGRPRRIRVTHLADAAAPAPEGSAASGAEEGVSAGPAGQEATCVPADDAAVPTPAGRQGRKVVAVAAGPGLAELFTGAGAVVVEASTTHRASTGEILDAIDRSGAAEVVVLPNDEHSVRAARAAAATAETDADPAHPVRVVVIPTRTQVQGLAALAVHDPGAALERDVTEMTATARHVRDGALTIAARTAMTMAGPCSPGDVLGVIAGDFVVVGQDREAVIVEVLQRLLAPGGDLVTLVAGEDGGTALAAHVAAWVETHEPHIDVVTYEGGQQRYPLLLSVE